MQRTLAALVLVLATASAQAATEQLTLGGGCFWCLEAVYEQLDGVIDAESGYAGGHVDSPDYEQVSNGDTGHAEVVNVTFDPARISREDLLRVYFTIHDPTTVDRQGPDRGPQYRSIALYRDAAQKAAIESALKATNASGEWGKQAVTQVVPLTRFWPAEDYHQQYYELHGEEPYCSLVIAPKIAKFRKRFKDLLKPAS